MNGQTMSLKNILRGLTDAATYANDALRRDYAEKLREFDDDDLSFAPQPLCIANMRVTFSANVDERDRLKLENGGDVNLRFDGPDGNFKSEIVIRPYDCMDDDLYGHDA